MYQIEKDKILNCYVVWEVHKNYKVDKLHGTKKECKQWIEKAMKDIKSIKA